MNLHFLITRAKGDKQTNLKEDEARDPLRFLLSNLDVLPRSTEDADSDIFDLVNRAHTLPCYSARMNTTHAHEHKKRNRVPCSHDTDRERDRFPLGTTGDDLTKEKRSPPSTTISVSSRNATKRKKNNWGEKMETREVSLPSR